MNAMFERSSRPDALQLYWNRTTAWVLSCKYAAYFKGNFSQEHLSAAASVYSFHWSVKFSFRMINGTREEIEFSCTNCFRSIVLLVFVLATALCKFRFRPLRNKMINLVLVIKYHFDFRLQFDINKKCIFQRFTEILLNNGKWNYMTQLSTKWSTALGKRMSSINVRSA